MAESESHLIFTNTLYDKLKFIAQIVLPALGALYFALATIWGLPAAEKVIGTIAAVDTFLGVVLRVSTHQYYKSGANFDGDVSLVSKEDGSNKVKFNIERDPEEVITDEPGKHSLEFRILRQQSREKARNER